MQHVINAICTFFIALILQCTSHEFVFIAGYKVSYSAWRSIHWMTLSFTLSDSERSIFLLIQDLPKLEQGEEFSRIMARKPAGTSKLEIYKTATASCTWPSKSVYHCGVVLHTPSAHTLIFTSVKLGSTQGVCLDCQPTAVTPAVTRDCSPTLLKLCVLANQAALQGTHLLPAAPTCWQRDLCLSLEPPLERELLTVLGWQQRPGILLKYLSALQLLKDLI